MARLDREIKIEEVLKDTKTKVAGAVSALAKATAAMALLTPWLHDNIIKDLGDVSAGNRADLSKTLDPAFAEVLGYMDTLSALHALYDENVSDYHDKVTGYLTANPDAITAFELQLDPSYVAPIVEG